MFKLVTLFVLATVATATASIYGYGGATLIGPSAVGSVYGPDGGAILAAPKTAGVVTASITPGVVSLGAPLSVGPLFTPVAPVVGLGKVGLSAVLSGPSGVVSSGPGGAVLAGPSATVYGKPKLLY